MNLYRPSRNFLHLIRVARSFSNVGYKNVGLIPKKIQNYKNPIRNLFISQKFLIEHTDVNEIKEISNDALNAIKNCGHSAYNKPLESRVSDLAAIWTKLQPESLNIDIYNAYIEVCIENETPLNHKDFLKQMQCEPNEETLELLLESCCCFGDVEQAINILALMKEKGHPVNERVFNALIMGHIISGGIEAGNSVLQTMKVAHIPESVNTHWAIIKALAKSSNKSDFTTALKSAPKLPYNPKEFFNVLRILGSNGNHLWLQQFLDFLGEDYLPRQDTALVDELCFSFIYRSCPEASIHLFKSLIDTTEQTGYASHLLQEMLIAKILIETIIKLSKDLIDSNLNPRALYDVTETALYNGLVEESLILFKHLDVIRPHFFWPLIHNQGRISQEVGVFEIVKKMFEFNVKPDLETFDDHVLLYCDLEDVDSLIMRLQSFELKMKEFLPPVVNNLVRRNKVKEANELCCKHDFLLPGEMLIKPLAFAWKWSKEGKDVEDVVGVLQKICETNKSDVDFVGAFLMRAFKYCKKASEFKKYVLLLNMVKTKNLRISSGSSDQLIARLQTTENCGNKLEIEVALDKLLDIAKQEGSHIQHPRNMNYEELQCHLEELINKNMETRGILRKLIQESSKLGNYEKVQEYRRMFKENNYEETGGMKSSLFFAAVQSGQLEVAEEIYKDINATFPGFKIDAYKIIEYAALLVKKDKCTEAIELLIEESKNSMTLGTMDKNCWRLLSEAKNPDDVNMIFQTLVECKYCLPNNTLLGPLVRIHLKANDLEAAMKTYEELCRKYKATPLQLEMFFAVIDAANEKFLDRMFIASTAVHGHHSTKITFIAALAEKGMIRPLERFLIEIKKVREQDLNSRCQRWLKEEKLDALQNLVKASKRLPPGTIDLSLVHMTILGIYNKRNDCEGALKYVKQLEEDDAIVPSEFYRDLSRLLKRCNYDTLKSSKAAQR